MKLAHDIQSRGHLGKVKSKDRLLLAEFYCPPIDKDVAFYCKTCDVYQKSKNSVKYKAKIASSPFIDQLFHRKFY